MGGLGHAALMISALSGPPAVVMQQVGRSDMMETGLQNDPSHSSYPWLCGSAKYIHAGSNKRSANPFHAWKTAGSYE